MTRRVPSTDGVAVALHELAGESAPNHSIVLVSHATGFHARAYLPMAAGLEPAFHVVGLDVRGHGDTPAPPDWEVDWTGYADDTAAVADELAGEPGGEGGLVGFGHSKGGATLLMAAHRSPDQFRLLVLYEPIVFPPVAAENGATRPPSPLVEGARRRRPTFPSLEDAIANYSSKPPLDAFDPEALDAYVRYGFGPDPDSDGVRLKCDPEHEARTFEEGAWHDTWARLPDITVPTLVVAGALDANPPAMIAEDVAARLPHGRYLPMPDVDHFGPFTRPRRVADLIATTIAEEDDTPAVP